MNPQMPMLAEINSIAATVNGMPHAMLANDVTMPVIGVGVSTIAGAVLGTFAAIGYDESERPRGRLFVVAFSTVIIASAATGAVPRAIGWEWANGVVEGGVAALCALICYFGLPELIPVMRRTIRGFKLSDLRFFRRSSPQDEGIAEAPPSDDGDPRR